MLESGLSCRVSSSLPSEDLWNTLINDAERPIVVVDPSGSVLFANRHAAEHVGAQGPDELIGRRMHDVCDHEYAEERLSLIREVVRVGRPIAVDGMTRGVWRRTVMRPIGNGDPQSRNVLMMHIPARRRESAAMEGYEVRRATVQDYGPLSKLTTREIEVLKLIGEGCTTAQIAKRLHRSVKTIEWHRVSLGNKLDAANRVELARIAIRAGLVDLDTEREASQATAAAIADDN